MKKKELFKVLEEEGVVTKHESGWYRVATKEEILDAINYELLVNRYTTTLDVKTRLRNRGFWILQEDVSFSMDQLAQVGVLGFLDNGTFRHYFYTG